MGLAGKPPVPFRQLRRNAPLKRYIGVENPKSGKFQKISKSYKKSKKMFDTAKRLGYMPFRVENAAGWPQREPKPGIGSRTSEIE